jgi:3-methyladenine DNA glycosylase AlkD
MNRRGPERPLATPLEVIERLRAIGDPKRAKASQWYFKTGPGEYGEGDLFVGIPVPALRTLAREYGSLPLPETVSLLRSEIHEARLLALLILVRAYGRADGAQQEEIFRLYLENTRFINNWDLVDSSAPYIVGPHLLGRSREALRALAGSSLLWERRIAVLATFRYIKEGDFSESLHIAGALLRDPEDLIHKATGWMLREIGRYDQAAEEGFLKVHYRGMPRTMLRYAIERFPEDLRRQYLRGEV